MKCTTACLHWILQLTSAIEMLLTPEYPFLYVVCKEFEQTTLEISSDVSEVFDWSALKIVSTPETPILFPAL